MCTDDFMGPSPHNVNLAAKGIIGVSSFGFICKQLGLNDEAEKYFRLAKDLADIWQLLALDSDKTHFRLEYYRNNTFSLKYNLLFQYIIGLDTFPQSVIETELKFYMSKTLTQYGIPLDSRSAIAKLDWMYWIAAMGTQEQFETLNKAGYHFADTTPSRAPLTDWYSVDTGIMKGFTARPVVGGLYSRILLKSSEKQN